MSKSRGNYVSLTASAGDVFGKLMSVPDRLVPAYLAALSELQDSEIELCITGVTDGRVHPMDLKKFLAGEITAALHGVAAAMQAREEFVARFSARRFADAGDLPNITNLSPSVVDVLKGLGFAKSNGEVRRIAQQDGLRLIVETDHQQHQVTLSVENTHESLADVLREKVGDARGDFYQKLGRKLARIEALRA
jgi:tyrosyl-tRNA synthetase